MGRQLTEVRHARSSRISPVFLQGSRRSFHQKHSGRAVIRPQRRHLPINIAQPDSVLYGVAHIANIYVTYATEEAVVVRDPLAGLESHPVRADSHHHVRWFYV